MENKDLYQVIRKMIINETKFSRTFLGQVKDIQDPLKLGRVLVVVPELGWFTQDQGCWCNVTDKKMIIVPKLNDWVIVFFLNGNPDRPYYFGIAGEIANSLPQNYDGQPTTNILFENNNKDTYIKLDNNTNELKLVDKNNNQITIDQNGIKITDKNQNTIEMTSGEIKFNGTNCEVLL